MRVGFWYDDRMLLHDNGPGHPERAARLEAVRDAAASGPWAGRLSWHPAMEAQQRDLELVHDRSFLDRLAASEGKPRTVFDADTSANAASYLAALLAAGASVAAVELALAGAEKRSFVAARPPGHHAERDRAMGFCFLNNVAVAAAAAVARGGVDRVAIIDWDVHHGNGTDHIFYERGDVFYVSLHQALHYPGTGHAREAGAGPGLGRTMNVPLPPGTDEAEYLLVLDELVIPALDDFRPELVLVSAGFDAHERDPLAGMLLRGASYSLITERLVALAERHAAGRIVHVLEGGYDQEGLRAGVDGVLSVLTGRSRPSPERRCERPDAAARRSRSAVRRG